MSETLTKLTCHLVGGMAWSKKRPSEEKAYWVKWDGMQASTVFVYHNGDAGLYVYGEAIDSGPLLSLYYVQNDEGELLHTNIQWSGPIPMPTDAPAQAYYKAEEVEALIAEMRQALTAVVQDYEIIQGPYKRAYGNSYDEPKSITNAQRLLARLRGNK